MIEADGHELEEKRSEDNLLEDTLVKDELLRIRDRLNGKKKQIFDLIFLKGYTNQQTALELGISRQYVHRVKKELIGVIKEDVLDIKEN